MKNIFLITSLLVISSASLAKPARFISVTYSWDSQRFDSGYHSSCELAQADAIAQCGNTDACINNVQPCEETQDYPVKEPASTKTPKKLKKAPYGAFLIYLNVNPDYLISL